MTLCAMMLLAAGLILRAGVQRSSTEVSVLQNVECWVMVAILSS